MTDDNRTSPQSDLTEQQLDALLLEGINSGPAKPMTEEDWAYIRAEARRRAGICSSTTRPSRG
jgi:hypothetical protein